MKINPQHKVFDAYYDTLKGMGQMRVSNELSVRLAFEGVLNTLAPGAGWRLVPEQTLPNGKRPDGTLRDGFFARGSTNSSSGNNASGQNGLPGNVPLPNGATFVSTSTLTNTNTQAVAFTLWFYTVASPNNPASVGAFYISNLPGNGWTHIHSNNGGTAGDYNVTGCQNGEVVGILSANSLGVPDSQGNTTSTITAPPGGSVLEIGITSDASQISLNCS